MAGHDLWRQKQAQDTFEDLADLVTAPEDPEESQAESSAPEESAEAQEPQEEQRNLSLLFEQNADCIGWICIPGTAVDYPLMHTPEDSEKYLRKDFYGAYSINGVPFLDGRCSLESANLIIYGHNMKNGTMFGSLKTIRMPVTMLSIQPLSWKLPLAKHSIPFFRDEGAEGGCLVPFPYRGCRDGFPAPDPLRQGVCPL